MEEEDRVDHGVPGGRAQGGQARPDCPPSSRLRCLYSCRRSGSLFWYQINENMKILLMTQIIVQICVGNVSSVWPGQVQVQ